MVFDPHARDGRPRSPRTLGVDGIGNVAPAALDLVMEPTPAVTSGGLTVPARGRLPARCTSEDEAVPRPVGRTPLDPHFHAPNLWSDLNGRRRRVNPRYEQRGGSEVLQP